MSTNVASNIFMDDRNYYKGEKNYSKGNTTEMFSTVVVDAFLSNMVNVTRISMIHPLGNITNSNGNPFKSCQNILV